MRLCDQPHPVVSRQPDELAGEPHRTLDLLCTRLDASQATREHLDGGGTEALGPLHREHQFVPLPVTNGPFQMQRRIHAHDGRRHTQPAHLRHQRVHGNGVERREVVRPDLELAKARRDHAAQNRLKVRVRLLGGRPPVRVQGNRVEQKRGHWGRSGAFSALPAARLF